MDDRQPQTGGGVTVAAGVPHGDGAAALEAGVAAWREGRFEIAAAAFSAVAAARPDDARGHANLGVVLKKMGHIPAALASQAKAEALDPLDAANLSNYGNTLREAGRLDESEARLRRAVELAPGNPGFRHNLALCLRDACRSAEAEAILERVVSETPGDPEPEWDLALTRLALGDWRRGFAGYESRWRLSRVGRREVPGAAWDGRESPEGRTLFLTAEQGFGDALQFARFLPAAVGTGARVVVEAAPELAAIFAAFPGVAGVSLRNSEPPPYDRHAPMMSLPHLMGLDPSSAPTSGYLPRPRRLVRPLPLPSGRALKIGIVWAGKPTPLDRSWPLEAFAPLFEDPRLAFASLQVGPRAADLAASGFDRTILDVGSKTKDFADTAAAMADLDAVVTIDSAPAHLACAFGIPTLVLLRRTPDWRWGDSGRTTPWYSTATLLRQRTFGDFDGPVSEAAAILKAMAEAKA